MWGGGLSREIEGIRILHRSDMERFMMDGEVLVTSLKAYENTDEREFRQHLQALHEKHITGFVIKRNQETEQQVRYFEILLEFAEKHQIPVIEIPQAVYFCEIVKYVLAQIFDLTTAKLIFFKMAHDNLSYISLQEGDFENTIRRMLMQINIILGNPVALYDAGFKCLISSEMRDEQLELADDRTELVTDVLTQYTIYRQKREYVEYVKKFTISSRYDFYLLITERDNLMNEFDFIALQNMVVSLQYTIERAVIKEEAANKYRGDLGYRLLKGALSDDEEDEAARILDLHDEDDLRVVIFRLMPKSNTGKFTGKMIKETELAETEMYMSLPKKYILTNTNQIIYIHKKGKKEEDRDFRIRIEDVQRTVQDKLIRKKLEIDFQAGIGKSVKGYHHLHESFKDSKTAIKYISLIRTVVGDQKKSVVDCSKLGFFHMFVDVQDKSLLEAYIPESLHHLYEYDQKKNGELIKTLECYMNNKQSIKATSEAMFAHYRTISYRLQKIVNISGMDFDNPTEMLSVRNGLIIYRILENM